jgi:hypothetical protein
VAIAIEHANMLQGIDASIDGGNPTMVINTNQTVAANGFITFGVVWWESGTDNTLTSVSGGTGMTWGVAAQGGSTSGGGNPACAVAWGQCGAGGLSSGTAITFTFNTGGGGAAAACGSSWSGVKTTSPVDATGTVTNPAAAQTSWLTNAVTIANGSLLFGVAYNIDVVNNTDWMTATFTGTVAQDYGDINFGGLGTMYRIESTGASYQLGSGSNVSGTIPSIAAGFLEAAGGGGPAQQRRPRAQVSGWY